jgi:outer membrane protein W
MKLPRNYPSILISVALILLSFDGVYAQVQKGDMNIGLSSSFTTQSGSPQNMSITGLVSFERYFTSNISVGLAPLLSIITSEGALTSVYGVNVFGNYNFLTKSAKFLPYVGLLGSINQSISNLDSRSDQNGNQTVVSGNTTVSFYGIGGKAGTKYFLTERINLDANVNYATNLSSKVNGEDLDLGEGGQLQLFFGLGVILGRKGN